MKRAYVIIMAVVVAAAVAAGCSRGYESKRIVDDLSITIKADGYPLVKGDNALTVKVADAAGAAVTGATVNARYYMPPMAGMAPMEFSAKPVPKGDAHAFTANIPMEGGWKVEVTVTRPGKPAVSATFNVDAR